VQVSGETDMRMLTLERFTIYRVLQSLNTINIVKLIYLFSKYII